MFEKHSAIMMVIEQRSGRIIDANQAASKFYGYSIDQLRNLNISSINQLVGADSPAIEYSSARDKNSSVFLHRLSDGSVKTVELHSTAIGDSDNPLLYSIVFDITEQKNTMNDLHKLSQAIRQSSSTVVITDADGKIEYVNPQFEKITGYSADEALGQNPKILKSGVHTPEFYSNMWTTLNSGQEWIGDVCNRKKNGELYWERASIAPVLNEQGKATHYVAVKDDITKRKQMEKELVEARDSAEAASVAKSEFLANMSHEIRTPMNGVIGMTGLLLDTELNEEQRRYADTIRSSGETLLALINDILDFSKIEAGKLELENLDFDLRSMLDDFAAALALRAHEKGLEFICATAPDLPTYLCGDPGRLRQILTNLAGNAVKFTSKGEISVTASLVSENESEVLVRFSVKDTGIGIPADKQSKLFQKFSQADASTTRKYGGTGLGLAISKQLAEIMGGEVGINSEDGHGSEFWFTARLGKQIDQHPVSFQSDISGAHVLVVDDNATNREIFRTQLKSRGVRVEECSSGPAALAALYNARDSKDTFQVAILDMQMPGMDGVALARAIKSDGTLNNTRLMLMTSLGGQRGDAKRMKDVGFAAYLSKPVRQSDLFNTLAVVLSGTPVDNSTQPIITRHIIREMRRGAVRILLAEDNITNQQVAKGILKKLGFLRVDLVADGAEAVSALEDLPYDLVLMDCHMPEMDGYEATRKIRNPASTVMNHNIPIIAMTANAMQGDREKCLEAGMNDYVSKPVSPKALADALEKWLPKDPDEATEHSIEKREDTIVKTAAVAAVTKTSVFDIDKLLENQMNDEDLALNIVKVFLEEIPKHIEKLRAHIATGDIKNIIRMTHSIKGASAVVFCEAMRSLAFEMEQASISGNLETVVARLPELDAQFGFAKTEIERYLAAKRVLV